MLHITSPAYPDTFAQHLGVDVGKRCAYLDLRDAADLETIQRLARRADVFTTTYRAGVNTRFRLLPAELAAASARGIVCMTDNFLPFLPEVEGDYQVMVQIICWLLRLFR